MPHSPPHSWLGKQGGSQPGLGFSRAVGSCLPFYPAKSSGNEHREASLPAHLHLFARLTRLTNYFQEARGDALNKEAVFARGVVFGGALCQHMVGGTRGFIPRAGEWARMGAGSKPQWLPCLCRALTPSKDGVKAQLVQVRLGLGMLVGVGRAGWD